MVPAGHLLRRIDAVLDLSWLRGEMKTHYSHLGCPSICPELMVRMLVIGYPAADLIVFSCAVGLSFSPPSPALAKI